MFASVEADEQPGPSLSRDIQLVQVVESSAHLLRPVFNPAVISFSTFRLAAGVGVFSLIRITAPAQAALVITNVRNNNVANSLTLLYGIPTGLVIGASLAPFVTPENAFDGIEGPLMTQGTATAAAGPGPNTLLAAEADSEWAPLLVDPGSTLNFISAVDNTIVDVGLWYTQVG